MKDYEIVLNARKENVITMSDYLKNIVTDFIEFHGDRYFSDDSAVIGGIGYIGNTCVTVIGIEKGKNTEERVYRNFGSAHPEGYRKALRLMKQAEKFKRPILLIVDTAGAYPGVSAEERGQGRAIANNLYEMSTLKTPMLSLIIGEGGSGGALALAHADKIWMLENAYFSVVSPESCANILWKSTERADVVAEALMLTAEKLEKLNLIDKIISNEKSGELKNMIENELNSLMKNSIDDLLELRYRKFRRVGEI